MIPRRSILDRRRPADASGGTGGRRPTGGAGRAPGPERTWRERLGADRLGVLGTSAIAGLILVAGAGLIVLFGGERFGPSPDATATPVGTLPAGSLPPDASVAAFLALATDPARTMHIDTTTTARVDETQAVVASQLDHAGPAYAGRIEVTDTNTRTPTDVVVLPPDAYARDPTGPWRKGEAPERPLDPLFGLTVATPVADLGPVAIDGQELRHVRIAMLPVDATWAPDIREIIVTSTTYDLWIDAQGRPVRGTFDLVGSGITHEGAEPERRVPLSLRSDFTFSRVGEPVEIVAPTT